MMKTQIREGYKVFYYVGMSLLIISVDSVFALKARYNHTSSSAHEPSSLATLLNWGMRYTLSFLVS